MRSIEKQIKRVRTIIEMADEKLLDFESDREDQLYYEGQNPNECLYLANNRTSHAEVKRLMLVLRQEMIKLDKML